MFAYALLREQKHKTVAENFKRKQIVGNNVSNLGLKTTSCEHLLIGRKPSYCVVWYKSAKV